MKSILVPIDFSNCSLNALNYALELANHFKSDIKILNAYHLPSAGGTTAIWTLQDDMRDDIEKELEKIKKRLSVSYPNLTIGTKADCNLAVNAIIEETEEVKHDLVVMGTKGATGLKDVFLGSIAATVIGQIKTPLLTVPDEVHYSNLDRFVLASDLKSIKNHDNIRFLASLADTFSIPVNIINIVEDEEKESLEESFAALKEILKIEEDVEGVDHELSVVESYDIEKTLLHQAKRKNTIISVIKRDRSFIQRIFHKSLSKQLAKHSKSPILIMHDYN